MRVGGSWGREGGGGVRDDVEVGVMCGVGMQVKRVGGQASERACKRVGRWADGQVGGWADSRRLPFYSRNATPVIP